MRISLPNTPAMWTPPVRKGLVVLLALYASLLTSRSSSADEILKVNLVRSTISLHEPIQLQIMATNPTKRPIILDFGQPEPSSFSFEVIPGGKGIVRRLPSPLGAIAFSAGGEVTLAGGESYETKILLNDWLAFKTPGEFRLVVRFSGKVTSQGADLSIQRRFVLPLEITARDPELLMRLCRGLGEEACQSRDLKAAQNAAKALSWIDDPAAIPTLERVLRCGYIERALAIRGLKRIGTREAIIPLIDAGRSPDKDLADLALRALRDLLRARAELDPGIRRQIEELLDQKVPPGSTPPHPGHLSPKP